MYLTLRFAEVHVGEGGGVDVVIQRGDATGRARQVMSYLLLFLTLRNLETAPDVLPSLWSAVNAALRRRRRRRLP